LVLELQRIDQKNMPPDQDQACSRALEPYFSNRGS
jgi:hypothetical protein